MTGHPKVIPGEKSASRMRVVIEVRLRCGLLEPRFWIVSELPTTRQQSAHPLQAVNWEEDVIHSRLDRWL